jgi:uncharacterized membrane protein YfcA
MHLEPWQWALAVVGAFIAGMSKTGIAGLGILCVALFTNVLPAKAATGFVLPLLIVGDLYAVASYRRHTVWRHLWRLFPWTALGVGLGTLALGRLDDAAVRRLIGAIIVAMLVLHVGRRWQVRRGRGDEQLAAAVPAGVGAAVGVLAGFTTQVANAAGPIMILYLLAMRLPKLEFIGTGAVFFLCLNLFKAPFMAGLGVITPASLAANALLAPSPAGGWSSGSTSSGLKSSCSG